MKRIRSGGRLEAVTSRVPDTSLGSVASLVALVVVAILSVGLLGGPVPALGVRGGRARIGDVPGRSPDPVKVFEPAISQKPEIRGSILFVKAGNAWTVSGPDVLTQFTNGGHDQYASWSRDGSAIYVLQIKTQKGEGPRTIWPCSSTSSIAQVGTGRSSLPWRNAASPIDTGISTSCRPPC